MKRREEGVKRREERVKRRGEGVKRECREGKRECRTDVRMPVEYDDADWSVTYGGGKGGG